MGKEFGQRPSTFVNDGELDPIGALSVDFHAFQAGVEAVERKQRQERLKARAQANAKGGPTDG